MRLMTQRACQWLMPHAYLSRLPALPCLFWSVRSMMRPIREQLRVAAPSWAGCPVRARKCIYDRFASVKTPHSSGASAVLHLGR